jgi:hypothetical protein
VAWHSLLREQPQIKLTASRDLPWSEVWVLDASPVWHVGLAGIPVVHQQDPEGLRRPEWRPWPGEEVTIDVSRPEGVAGQTLTIDGSKLKVTPGLRATDATLELQVRSSRGGQHALTLPPDAILQSVGINGKPQPIRQDKRKVTVPLVPGAQTVTLVWRDAEPVRLLLRTPPVDLGAPSVNAETELQMSRDRWILVIGGPRLGPAVLFWSTLVILVIVALGLARVGGAREHPLTPLGTLQWLLLCVGLSQVPIALAAMVAAWPMALGLRKRRGDTGARFWFNLSQLGLVALSAIALGILVAAIHEGLLGRPDMQIRGNGSHGELLRWFSDRTTGPLPEAWVISVPLLVYRGAMLLWALWLARSLVTWLRWGWEAFSAGGLWRKAPPKPPKPAPPPVTTETPPTPATPA